MMKLFGAFCPATFEADERAFPLSPGHERRVAIYQIYPLLVHVCLFGGSYVGQLSKTLERALRP